jgi:hypothetical protein
MLTNDQKQEVVEAMAEAMPDLYALVHSDQSTEDYPDLTYAKLDKRKGAETLLAVALPLIAKGTANNA